MGNRHRRTGQAIIGFSAATLDDIDERELSSARFRWLVDDRILFLLVPIVAASQVEASKSPVVELEFDRGASIQVDGSLDEPEWQRAARIRLTQQEPHPGMPSRYPTEIYLLSNGSNLYIGASATDPEPGRVSVHALQRDATMEGDDTLSVVLDTFDDRRTAFLFRINAAGGRQDGLIDATGLLALDWDGIWDAAVTTTGGGWSAEIVVPARSLNFSPNRESWGFNVERHVPRDLLTLRWAGTSLDSRFTDLRRAGKLAGASRMEQGIGLTVTPYVVGNASRNFPPGTTSTGADAGLDVDYSLTPELSGILTVNTDFAQTEVDSRQLNLTRFPLFFPEKRAFFLEGSNQFVFGEGLDEVFIPFFSRRVGLVEGEEVPIAGGVKLIGRAGSFGVGLLDVWTEGTDTVPNANLFAGRLTYDATDRLRIGMIGTSGDPRDDDSNSLVGADATWRTSEAFGDKNLVFNAWGVRSSGDIPTGDSSGWGMAALYPNDLWDLKAYIYQFGDTLDPALGFLPRPGTRHYHAEVNWQPRPTTDWLSWMRQFFMEYRYTRIDDLDGNNQSWLLWTAPIKLLTEAGEDIELNYLPQGETLTDPFAVAEGVVIPPGEYDFQRFRVTVRSSTTRRWRLGARVWFGEFFEGDLTTLETIASLTTLGARLQLSLESEQNWGSLPQGKFDRRLWKFRAGYDFNPDLRLQTFVQYDNDSDLLGANTRLRWIVAPGRDLFVVWNHGWTSGRDGSEDFKLADLDSLVSELSVKFSWAFRP